MLEGKDRERALRMLCEGSGGVLVRNEVGRDEAFGAILAALEQEFVLVRPNGCLDCDLAFGEHIKCGAGLSDGQGRPGPSCPAHKVQEEK